MNFTGIYLGVSECSIAFMTAGSFNISPLRFICFARSAAISSSVISALDESMTSRAGIYKTPAGSISWPYSILPFSPRVNRYKSI